MSDQYNLQRFLDAQAPLVETVTAELEAGAKRSHWMWFIFPQVRGLGHSPTARHFALAGLAEARAYLAHPLLGQRLRNWTQIVVDLQGRTAQEIFGYPDYLKFRSSMTLFAAAEESLSHEANESLFRRALDKYYGGAGDEATLRHLENGA